MLTPTILLEVSALVAIVAPYSLAVGSLVVGPITFLKFLTFFNSFPAKSSQYMDLDWFPGLSSLPMGFRSEREQSGYTKSKRGSICP